MKSLSIFATALLMIIATGCTPRLSLNDVKNTGAIKQDAAEIKDLVRNNTFLLSSWEKSYNYNMLFKKSGVIRAKGMLDKKEVSGSWRTTYENKLCIKVSAWDYNTCYDIWTIDKTHYLFMSTNALEFTMEINHESLFNEITREQRILTKTKECPNCTLAGADLSKLDLHNANLEGADLSGANLELANLEGANLKGAVMQEVRLTDALCSGADFSGADLSRANMHWGDFSKASFKGANMQGAYLIKANFFKADFTNANTTDVETQRTFFEGTVGLDPALIPKEIEELEVDKLEKKGDKKQGKGQGKGKTQHE